MSYRLDEMAFGDVEKATRLEWMLSNGIGGYSMGTPIGIQTRRYHGLLIASLQPPADRMVLLADIHAQVSGDGQTMALSSSQYPGVVHPDGHRHLRSFQVGETVEWKFESGELAVVLRLAMHQGKNACTLQYENAGSGNVSLTLRPLVCHKPHHANFRHHAGYPESIELLPESSSVWHQGVALTISHPRAMRAEVDDWYYRFEHRREMERGLDPYDDLYCPIELKFELAPGESAWIAAGTQEDVAPMALPSDNQVGDGPEDVLKQAVARFVVDTGDRVSIIAGYPWFTDWGRDTMISVPGALLCTGRAAEARRLLRDYAVQIRHGLIPNRFAEQGEVPDYNTADATLWFVNAIYKTLRAQWNREFGAEMAAACRGIFECHLRGTVYGIGVDPVDGLLRQGIPGAQLTWMDAKLGDWVVTPRHGKAVEINGLWINALRAMQWLREQLNLEAEAEARVAELAESNFESAFWREDLSYYLDVADPEDRSLRPNQVVAMALPFSPVEPFHAARALSMVREHLETPCGLRTLSPTDADYRGRFEGPMHDLDSAYHQGTVWPWLLGPYATAVAKYGAGKSRAEQLLRGAISLLGERGLGGISEVYNGDAPHRGNGCPWQAWSAAEILRAWIEDVGSRDA